MHLCNPRAPRACTRWCHEPSHVDLAYYDPVLMAAAGIDPLAAFLRVHAAHHVGLYQTPPCTIVDVVPAPDAPPMDEHAQGAEAGSAPVAYRVTYQVHAA